jgi:L-seryl-tRNA(Ser) seleniumtransferase
MKVDKGEIIGCLTALEWWNYHRDHKGEWKEWEGYLNHISDTITKIPSVRTEVRKPSRINVTPTLSISWDEQSVGISPKQVSDELLDGKPRIKMAVRDKKLTINPYMLELGEEKIVAKRLKEILLS